MIDIYVQKTQARAELDAPVTSGSIGRAVQFQFSADWDGLTKTAVFETNNYRESRSVPESGTVKIPPDVLAYPGYQLRIGVIGKSADGVTVIPTVYADCDSIKPGASTVPVGSPVKPSQAEALQREIDVLEARLVTLIDPNDPENVAAVDFTPTNLGSLATGKITSNGTHAIVTIASSISVTMDAGEELEIATIPEGFEPVANGFVPYNAGKFASLKVKVSDGKVYLVNDTENGAMTGKLPPTATFAYALKNPVFAEQADIRVGYDGTRYETAGDAVREQIKAAMRAASTGVSPVVVKKAVEEYLDEHPVESGGITKETDPTVPAWAKEPEKPRYTAAEVGARSADWMPTAADIGALPNTYTPPDQTAAQVGADPAGTAAAVVSGHNTNDGSHGDIRLLIEGLTTRLNALANSTDEDLDQLAELVAYIKNNKSLIDGITTSKVSVSDIINNLTTNVSNKPLSAAQGVALKGLIDALSGSLADYQPKGDYALKSAIPTKVSQLTNDKGYLTEHQDISGKLDASALPSAVNDALEQAKASGEFDGKNGDPGKDGTSPVVSVAAITGGHRITITDANGTKTVDVMDGTDGDSVTVKSVSESTADGGSNVVTFSDGKTLTVKNGSKGGAGKGITSVVRTSGNGAAGTTDTYTITYTDETTSTFTVRNGANGANGYNPVRGTDYWTPADKAEIVAMVIESLGGNPIFGIVDENNNIIVNGDLPDGTYSVKYEMANGKTVNIGNLVLDSNVYYTVTKNLTNCTISNSATQAVGGQSYSATIAAKSGYELKSVTVTMGGSPVTVSGGTINIASVTGNIVITAVAEEVVAPEPTYTNLAKNFTTGRFNSSGAVDASTTAATACTDYIGPLENGDIIRIKGFGAGTDYNSQWANASKGNNSAAKLANTSAHYSYSYDSATGIITLTKTSDNAGYTYYRISGILAGTTADVIITLNEPIV